MELSVTGSDAAGATVLGVAGEVDVHSSPVLRARIADLLDSGRPRLVVDLGDVDFLDSTGRCCVGPGLARSGQVDARVRRRGRVR